MNSYKLTCHLNYSILHFLNACTIYMFARKELWSLDNLQAVLFLIKTSSEIINVICVNHPFNK